MKWMLGAHHSRGSAIVRGVLALLLIISSSLGFAGPSLPPLRNDDSQLTPVGSSPVWLGKMGGFIFFIAQPSTTPGGAALFKTDGTTAGTTQVAAIAGEGIWTYQAGTLFISAGDKAYFLADTTADGQEVWVTDGTGAGTHQVAHIYTGQSFTSPTLLGLIGGDLIFAESVTDGTLQLFRTDGTAAGTHSLSNFASSQYGLLTESVEVNGKIYVALESNLSCCQPDLWTTDGTASGTVQIDSNEGYPWHLQPSSLRAFGNFVALLTDTENDGTELSVVNTKNNALSILDRIPGPGSGASYGSTIAVMDGFILYLSGDPNNGQQLWRSDGTLAGTEMVMDMGPGVQSSQLSQDIVMTRVGDRAIFQSENSRSGPQLWSSDGTVHGTVPLISTPTPSFYVQPLLGVVGNQGYYAVYTGSDYRVVVTDGTAAGTHVLTNTGPLDPNGLSDTQVVGNDDLAFIYTYYYDDTSGNSEHLYAYRPRSKMLTHLLDCVLFDPSEPSLAYSGRLYFKSSDPLRADQPWVSDGTVAGTQILADLDNNASIMPSPNSLSFGTTTVGSTSAAETVTIKNVDLSTVSLPSIALSGPQAVNFVLSRKCSATLASGQNCLLSVAFKPVSAGAKSAILRIAAAGSALPQAVTLTGTGTTGAPTFTLSTKSLVVEK